MTAKYQVIYQALRRSILSGRLAPNTPLPSENALAIKYGVSRITSKRALNELAAADLIYRVQGVGSFVKGHRTSNGSRRILLVIPFADSHGIGNYEQGISDTLADTDWELLSMPNQQFAALPIKQIQQEYAGVLYYPTTLSADTARLITLYLAKIPIVLLDKTIPGVAIPSVTADNEAGGQLAVQHLLKLGHRRIAFLARTNFWDTFTGTVSARFFGYLNGYRNDPPAASDPLAWAQALTTRALPSERAAFLRQEKISAVVVENDLEALRFMQQLKQLGWSLPADLSVVGFDDLPAARLQEPALTTIRQDFVQIGTEAVNTLLAQMNDPAARLPEHKRVPVTLVTRASTVPFN